MGHRTGNRVVRALYTLLLGVLIALFVGLGTATVHPAPAEPQAPPALAAARQTRELAPEEQLQWAAHERDREAWEEQLGRHSRDLGVAALAGSVLLLVLGALLERRRPVLADGVLLGGLFTLLYSVVRGLLSGDTLVAFGLVTAGLFLVLHLGYRRFVDRPTATGDGPGPGPVVVSPNGKHPSRR